MPADVCAALSFAASFDGKTMVAWWALAPGFGRVPRSRCARGRDGVCRCRPPLFRWHFPCHDSFSLRTHRFAPWKLKVSELFQPLSFVANFFLSLFFFPGSAPVNSAPSNLRVRGREYYEYYAGIADWPIDASAASSSQIPPVCPSPAATRGQPVCGLFLWNWNGNRCPLDL